MFTGSVLIMRSDKLNRNDCYLPNVDGPHLYPKDTTLSSRIELGTSAKPPPPPPWGVSQASIMEEEVSGFSIGSREVDQNGDSTFIPKENPWGRPFRLARGWGGTMLSPDKPSWRNYSLVQLLFDAILFWRNYFLAQLFIGAIIYWCNFFFFVNPHPVAAGAFFFHWCAMVSKRCTLMVRWPEMDTKNNQTGYATAVTKRTRTYVYTFVFEALWARNFDSKWQFQKDFDSQLWKVITRHRSQVRSSPRSYGVFQSNSHLFNTKQATPLQSYHEKTLSHDMFWPMSGTRIDCIPVWSAKTPMVDNLVELIAGLFANTTFPLRGAHIGESCMILRQKSECPHGLASKLGCLTVQFFFQNWGVWRCSFLFWVGVSDGAVSKLCLVKT